MLDETWEQEEFVGQIIDLFEDFLEHFIPENCEEPIDTGNAIIVGNDYDELSRGIRGILKRWDIAR